MTFYKECIGGELSFQVIGDSPLSAKMPKKMKDCILHSSLSRGNILLMGSDLTHDAGLIRGNSVSLALHCSSEEELRTFYERLSSGGLATHRVEETFWGAMFGTLTDKYGNHWLLNYEKSKN
jgi:PhnB protein